MSGILAAGRRLIADQRVRFLIVGGFNTAFGFLVFVAVDLTLGSALNPTGEVVSSVVTLVVSHLIAAIVAFILYRRLVFRVSGNVVIDFLRFETVYLVPLAVNIVILPALVVWGMNRILAQAIILVTMTIFSYLGHRFFSFRRSEASVSHESPRQVAGG